MHCIDCKIINYIYSKFKKRPELVKLFSEIYGYHTFYNTKYMFDITSDLRILDHYLKDKKYNHISILYSISNDKQEITVKFENNHKCVFMINTVINKSMTVFDDPSLFNKYINNLNVQKTIFI